MHRTFGEAWYLEHKRCPEVWVGLQFPVPLVNDRMNCFTSTAWIDPIRERSARDSNRQFADQLVNPGGPVR